MSKEKWAYRCCLIIDENVSEPPFDREPMARMLREARKVKKVTDKIPKGYDEACDEVIEAALTWRPLALLRGGGALAEIDASPSYDKRAIFIKFIMVMDERDPPRHVATLLWFAAKKRRMKLTAIEWCVPHDMNVSTEEALVSGPPTGYTLNDEGEWDLDAETILLLQAMDDDE